MESQKNRITKRGPRSAKQRISTVPAADRGLSFGCKDKVPYDSKEDALEAGCTALRPDGRKLKGRVNEHKIETNDCTFLRAYECEFCGKFHLTKVWAPE